MDCSDAQRCFAEMPFNDCMLNSDKNFVLRARRQGSKPSKTRKPEQTVPAFVLFISKLYPHETLLPAVAVAVAIPTRTAMAPIRTARVIGRTRIIISLRHVDYGRRKIDHPRRLTVVWFHKHRQRRAGRSRLDDHRSRKQETNSDVQMNACLGCNRRPEKNC